jgi:hypothetical protein
VLLIPVVLIELCPLEPVLDHLRRRALGEQVEPGKRLVKLIERARPQIGQGERNSALNRAREETLVA